MKTHGRCLEMHTTEILRPVLSCPVGEWSSPTGVTTAGLSLFADDATESAHGTDVKSVECELQMKSDTVKNWCCANNMVIGTGKTKCVLIGSKQGLRTRVNSEKYLNLEVCDIK